MNLRIHRLAVAEIDREVDYYDRAMRVSGPSAGGQDRCSVIPYQITQQDIVVLALAHTSRRPDYWARRTVS